jgi:lipoprotein-releasing system permease protein
VGDVVVQGNSLTGFPYYDEMVEQIQKLPEVRAAVPALETFGLLNVNNSIRRGVQVVGYDIKKIGLVNDFPKSLYRQYGRLIEKAEEDPTLKRQQRDELQREAAESLAHASFALPLPPDAYREIFPKARSDVANWPGMIVGAGVVGIRKDAEGKIERPPGLYTAWAKLTVVGVAADQTSPDLSDKGERNYWIVDDSRTKIWQSDTVNVYVPFDVLQKDLKMDQQQATRADTGEKEILPARTHVIHIGVKPGYDLQGVKHKVQAIVDQVVAQHSIPLAYPIDVETWEETQRTFIGAIEKEVVLVTFLFGMISVVAVFLIFCIFYMIVVEKTKDIGIIKSVGATSSGVAGIFLGYGLAIGIVGAGLGLIASYLIVHNINYLHTQLGRLMGIQIWNPEVYAFDIIPNTMDPKTVTSIVLVAIAASVIGSLVPAIRAARMNPVEALRWE